MRIALVPGRCVCCGRWIAPFQRYGARLRQKYVAGRYCIQCWSSRQQTEKQAAQASAERKQRRELERATTCNPGWVLDEMAIACPSTIERYRATMRCITRDTFLTEHPYLGVTSRNQPGGEIAEFVGMQGHRCTSCHLIRIGPKEWAIVHWIVDYDD